VGLGKLVELVPEIGLRTIGVGVSLLTLSGNAGQGQSRIQIGENQRFEVPLGALYGVLQQRDEYGDWQTTKTGVRLWEVGNQRMALTDDEIRALNAPMSNPADPRSTPPLVTPIPTDRDRMPPLPGMDMAPPDVGAIPGYEALPPPTIDDLLLDKQDSEVLGDNLLAAGSAKPAEGYEAHHIVPSNAGDARMDALRAQLVALGIDLNDAANGVWLPGPKAPEDAPEAYHRRLNNSDYNEAVAGIFDGVASREEALVALRDISNQLRDGNFPGVRPRPNP
jgi:A nuclease family of the HNH/ENDO VII superfamily with conserved AHH